MERLRRFLVASATMLALPLSSFAGYVDIVHDQHALDAYTANVAYVNITEDYHNKEIDKTRQKKEKIAKYHATMESIKELYKMSMQNVRGFGYESAYYRQIVEQFGKVPRNMGRAVKAISQSPIFNYVNSIAELAEIQDKVAGIIGIYIDVVNNGKIDLSSFTSGKNDKITQILKNAHTGKGDKYNFLDRGQRVTLALQLLDNLEDINFKLEEIVYLSNLNHKLGRMLYNLDPISWNNIMGGYMTADYVVHEWNSQMSTF